MRGFSRLWTQHDFDAAVFFVAKLRVGIRRVDERNAMPDYE